MIDATKYPQLAKMQEVQEASQAIGEFLEWLDEQRIGLASVIRGDGHDRWAPITEGMEKLLARHFGIDLNAVERERRAILAAHVTGVTGTLSEQEKELGACSISRAAIGDRTHDRRTRESDRSAGEEKQRGGQAGRCDAVRAGGAELGARGDNAAQHEVSDGGGTGNGAAHGVAVGGHQTFSQQTPTGENDGKA